MLKLRPYQTEMIDQARKLMREGTKKLIFSAATGSGKTVLAAFMLKTSSEKGLSSIFLVHRREILLQSMRTFDKVGLKYGIIAAGWPRNPRPKIQIASVGTLARRLKKIRKPDILIIDECFPGYTKIDGIRIDQINPGDSIRTHNGTGKVQKVFKRHVDSVVKLTFSSGKTLVCTPNHPIGTTMGFVPAFLLTKTDMVVTIIDYGMQNMFRSLSEEIMLKKEVSFGIFTQNDSELFQEAWGANNKIQENKRYVQAGSSCESFHKTPCYGMEADCSRRQWPRANNPRTSDITGPRMAVQCDSENRASSLLPLSLQNRCGEQRFKNRNRSKRIFSHSSGEKSSGCEKNILFGVVGVENIEFHEQGSSLEFERLCPKGIVYNLHVEPGNTYFAEEILVHNCHHVAAQSWAKVLEEYSSAYHIGLSATPTRTDGKGLGDWFDKIIQGPPLRSLINEGYLSDYKIYAPSTINTDNLHMLAGDFAKNELSEVTDKPTITGQALDHYRQLAPGKQVLIRCVSIQHSKNVAAQFKAAGINTRHVDGETPSFQRDADFRAFAKGELTAITQVDLVNEGLDIAGIECIIDLRPTMSQTLWLQFCGRSLRPAPGKVAIILDASGNCMRHGLPDEIREWTLEGRIKKKSDRDTVSVRACSRCFAVVKLGALQCRYCGFVFEIKPREVEHKPGELVEIKMLEAKQKRMELGMAKSREELYALAKARGYKNPNGFVHIILRARQVKKFARGRK